MTETTETVVKEYQSHIKSGFQPLHVALNKSDNATLWDVDGRRYIDFLSFIACTNMGNNNPQIVAAVCRALQQCPTANTTFMNPSYERLGQKVQEVFGYENILCMCSGADSVDSAIKLARKWGYTRKGIPIGKAFVLTTEHCHHGMTLNVQSLASERNPLFGPYMPGVGPISPSGVLVKYGNIDSLEKALSADHDVISAFLVEPIEGAAGCICPPEGYMRKAYELCKKYNVLFIDDEVQAGVGRAGYPLCIWADGIKPDVVCLGKSITGGVIPLSMICGHPDIMDVMEPGDTGSTMAANPPATEAAIAALGVLVNDKICEKSLEQGSLLEKLIMDSCTPHVVAVRGRGCFRGAVLNPDYIDENFNGRKLSELCAEHGLLTCALGHGLSVRLCPPPTISKKDLCEGVEIFTKCVKIMAELANKT